MKEFILLSICFAFAIGTLFFIKHFVTAIAKFIFFFYLGASLAILSNHFFGFRIGQNDVFVYLMDFGASVGYWFQKMF